MIECPHCGHRRRGRNSCPSCGRVDLDALRSVHISYEVNPSRMNDIPPSQPNNSFEKGIRKDRRGLPYLDRDGKPLRIKESFNPKDYGDATVQVSTGGNS